MSSIHGISASRYQSYVVKSKCFFRNTLIYLRRFVFVLKNRERISNKRLIDWAIHKLEKKRLLTDDKFIKMQKICVYILPTVKKNPVYQNRYEAAIKKYAKKNSHSGTSDSSSDDPSSQSNNAKSLSKKTESTEVTSSSSSNNVTALIQSPKNSTHHSSNQTVDDEQMNTSQSSSKEEEAEVEDPTNLGQDPSDNEDAIDQDVQKLSGSGASQSEEAEEDQAVALSQGSSDTEDTIGQDEQRLGGSGTSQSEEAEEDHAPALKQSTEDAIDQDEQQLSGSGASQSEEAEEGQAAALKQGSSDTEDSADLPEDEQQISAAQVSSDEEEIEVVDADPAVDQTKQKLNLSQTLSDDEAELIVVTEVTDNQTLISTAGFSAVNHGCSDTSAVELLAENDEEKETETFIGALYQARDASLTETDESESDDEDTVEDVQPLEKLEAISGLSEEDAQKLDVNNDGDELLDNDSETDSNSATVVGASDVDEQQLGGSGASQSEESEEDQTPDLKQGSSETEDVIDQDRPQTAAVQVSLPEIDESESDDEDTVEDIPSLEQPETTTGLSEEDTQKLDDDSEQLLDATPSDEEKPEGANSETVVGSSDVDEQELDGLDLAKLSSQSVKQESLKKF